MLTVFIRNSAVKLFWLITKLRLERVPLFNRAYLALYMVYKRYIEAGPIERLKEFVPAGSLVIDVGANVGFFTLRFAKWVGDGGKVIAIEPEDRNYANLVEAIEREGFSGRVEPLKAVAAATSGELFLEINPVNHADHKISRDGTGLPTSAVTLDQLVPDKAVLRPALVKIDVQGAEMMVLEGAAETLRLSGPALFIEMHEAGLNMFGVSISAILDRLAKHGYEAYWLARSGPHIRANPPEIHARANRSGYVDVLFLKVDSPKPKPCAAN
jgi:FkbM family methyltransferase